MKSIILAVCLLGISATPALAKAEEKTKAEVSKPSASTLQLKHILAPAQTSPGAFTSALRPMTPILVVPRDFNTPLVCQRAPRVAEALLQYFMQNPAPVNKKHRLDDKALETQKSKMAGYVNRAIGLKAVSAVYLIEGGKSMSTGVAARLPFANATSCGPVLEAYEKQVQEFLKEE